MLSLSMPKRDELILEEMGHLHQPTQILCVNSMAPRIANDAVKKTLKIHGSVIILDRRSCCTKIFHCSLAPMSRNLVDHFTKHHLASHHT